jgi:hypothetical protein
MELPGSGCFYALAALAMAFAGFTSIVVVLRQGTGKPLSPLHTLFTPSLYRIGIDGVGIRHVGACPGALRHARSLDMANIQRNHDCRVGAVAVFLSHSSKGRRSQGAIAASIL